MVQTADGADIMLLNKTGTIQIVDDDDKELETYNIVIGSVINIGDGQKIDKGHYGSCGILTTSRAFGNGGVLAFKDMIPGSR